MTDRHGDDRVNKSQPLQARLHFANRSIMHGERRSGAFLCIYTSKHALPCIRILDNGDFSRRVIDCCWALPNNSHNRLPRRSRRKRVHSRANNLCLFRCIKADDSVLHLPCNRRPLHQKQKQRLLLRKRKQFVRAKLFSHCIAVGHWHASHQMRRRRWADCAKKVVHPPPLHIPTNRSICSWCVKAKTICPPTTFLVSVK